MNDLESHLQECDTWQVWAHYHWEIKIQKDIFWEANSKSEHNIRGPDACWYDPSEKRRQKCRELIKRGWGTSQTRQHKRRGPDAYEYGTDDTTRNNTHDGTEREGTAQDFCHARLRALFKSFITIRAKSGSLLRCADPTEHSPCLPNKPRPHSGQGHSKQRR